MLMPTPPSDIALNLALALISASVAPVLLLDGDLSVIAASQSFREAYDVGNDQIPGADLADLGSGEWNPPQFRSLLKATVLGTATIGDFEMDLRSRQGLRHLVLNVRRLDYGDGDGVKLLLSIQDVTEARAGEKQTHDLIRDKATLVQEIQNRAANSLQVITSVLMQNVRMDGSTASRDHLRDSHHRVMSVAAVQRQLAGSALGDVELHGYLTDLCRSIGDAMIRDHDRLTLEVTADNSIASSGKAVSLGLIVTELVINALRYAFPDDREGRIEVDYRAHGQGWTLTVSDDGVGPPPDTGSAKPGLGTGIIQALVNRFGATISILDTRPGFRASIVCLPDALPLGIP